MPFSRHMTLGKRVNLSELHFPTCKTKVIIFTLQVVARINQDNILKAPAKITYLKHLAQYLTQINAGLLSFP